MSFEKLPLLDGILDDLEVATAGDACLVRKKGFLALCSLKTGDIIWCVSRNAPEVSENSCTSEDELADLMLWGTKLWIGLNDQVVAEIFYEDPESIRLVARCMRTGKILWEYSHRRPPLAPWAEEKPAWPGAPQEAIYVFLARSENNLVLCLHRRTRCSGIWTTEFAVPESPPFQCQTDLYSFEPTTGAIRWSRVQTGLRLDLLEWMDFRGLWVNDGQAGWLDIDSGLVRTIERKGCCFGMPNIHRDFGYFPWFDKKSKRVGYIRTNRSLEVDCEFSWNEKRVREVRVWPSSSGVAIQVTDQKVMWTIGGDLVWEQRAKPYIYRVFETDKSDVFVATDGAGGRLLGFDRTDGHETLNFRPVFGGLGDTYFFEEAKTAVASVAMKKSHSIASRLLIFDVETKSMEFVSSCWRILSRWSGGVVYLSGEKVRRLAFLDLYA